MPAMMLIMAKSTGNNQENFKKYVAEGPPMMVKYGGRFPVPYSVPQVLEGDWFGEYVILTEWDSREAALEFWNSAEYQELKKSRVGAIDAQILLFDSKAPKK